VNDAPGEVGVERLDGLPVARMRGEVDALLAGEARARVEATLENADLGLVVDLSEATYLDSAGINLVFELANRLRERQQRLAVVVPDRVVIRRALELVYVDSVAPVHESVAAAAEYVRAAGETGSDGD
jgi:anti-anti-sigma factor